MEMPGARLDDSALLIVDMISDFGFPDGDQLAAEAGKVVGNMVAVRRMFREQRRPVIYVNDNYNRWTAGFDALVEWAGRLGSRGSAMVDLLRPARDDFYILKPKHSAFFETALPSLLAHLQVRAVTLVGVAGDSCVLSSAMDAHIRELKVWVPSDATASMTRERNARAMQFLDESLGCDVRPSSCADQPARPA